MTGPAVAGKVLTGADLTDDVDVACDVCIVGSGAGGATLAAGLAQRGLHVVMLEEGGYHTSRDFVGEEGVNYPMLYQERGTRATADLAFTILQGRSVGGGTTVNWTTCFRTPDAILAHWRDVHGVEGVDPAAMAPHFDAVEARLGIAPWSEDRINENNRVLLDGARKLGYSAEILRRNVRNCQNSGLCGMGCPYDAKQGMLLTYLPDALAAGMTLYADARVERLEVAAGRVVAVRAVGMERGRDRATTRRIVVRPKVCVAAGGAINTPALLMRSGIGGSGLGERLFIHPVVAVNGQYAHPIEGWAGAPQSVSSHHFVDRGAGRLGYFLETPPVQPMLAAGALPVPGARQIELMRKLPYTSSLIALAIDGLLPGDAGGTVSLRADGRVRVDYPVTEPLIEAWRDAHRTMARIHLAAGAERVLTMHVEPVEIRSEADLRLLDAAPYGALQHAAFTAHQMGGCAMGGSPETSVVDSQHRHWHVANLFVVDGSVLPTSLGVNPSETIYGLAHRARDFVENAVRYS